MTLRLFSPKGSPPNDEETAPDSHFLGQYIPLHYHYNMLQDEDRVGAFRDAIALTVKSGMKVVELGGGTGILSNFAARQGAEVTCVERNYQLVENARKFLHLNAMANRVDVIHADAREFTPNEPVDVVICEMLHVAMLREKQLEVIQAFKSNHLAAFPDAPLPRYIPEASLLMVQPVEQSFDFAGYWAPVPQFHAAFQDQPRTRELAQMSIYATIIYDKAYLTDFAWNGTMCIREAGKWNALRFITQNAVAIDVAKQHSVNWPNQCLVLPIEQPMVVEKDQLVEVGFSYSAGDSIDDLTGSMRVKVLEESSQRVERLRQDGSRRWAA